MPHCSHARTQMINTAMGFQNTAALQQLQAASSFDPEPDRLIRAMCDLSGCAEPKAAFHRLRVQGRVMELAPYMTAPEERKLLEVGGVQGKEGLCSAVRLRIWPMSMWCSDWHDMHMRMHIPHHMPDACTLRWHGA